MLARWLFPHPAPYKRWDSKPPGTYNAEVSQTLNVDRITASFLACLALHYTSAFFSSQLMLRIFALPLLSLLSYEIM